jgi:hypothetical protein
MLDTITEEDTNTLRRVFRVIFVGTGGAYMGLAIYSSARAWETEDSAAGVGFVFLTVVLWTSCLFALVFERSCQRESALEMFQQPCILRWVGYAMTLPLQLLLCAWYAGVRDVHTLVLLVAAQVACALLGFVMEQAWNSEDLQEPVAERSDPLSLSVGTVIRGPEANPLLILTQRHKAMAAWSVCSVCIEVLHAAVWFVVLDAARKNDYVSDKRQRLDAMLHAHCGLLSALWLVSPLQVLIWWLGGASVEEGLVAGSMGHAVIDAAAKIQLGIAYALFIG